MRPTNYFKALVRRGAERTFAFDGGSRSGATKAFDRALVFATQHGARVSVCYAVPLGGPWDAVPVIVGAPRVAAAPVAAVPRFAPFGEGGCW